MYNIYKMCALFNQIGEVLQFCVCNIKPDSTSFFLRMVIIGIAVAIKPPNIFT